ncbi:hypothetical protein HBI80_000380 [Parastagonospora nodorum]|nr:hypothetical protein HBI80_000380 [Parastagonospora nodorum]
MKFFIPFVMASGFAAAAPLFDHPKAPAAADLKSTPMPTPNSLPGVPSFVGLDGQPGGLLSGKKGSASPVSIMATPSVTKAPEYTRTYATAFPSTFSAPVQGTGLLSLKNLPALPPVIDKTVSGVLGAAYGLMSGICNEEHKCTITMAGSLDSLLVDGDKYSAATTISGWCDAGHCYGSANPTVNATAPFEITCDKLTGTTACSATLAGAAEAIFVNGNALELWGWLTPSGYCKGGICTASIEAFGDPMY